MKFTIEEALKKWCPFIQVVYDVSNKKIWSNRGYVLNESEECTCLASDCVAWESVGLGNGYCRRMKGE